MANKQTEKAFQATVLRLAALLGYRVYHTYDSRRSQAGWPDLVLCKPPRVFFFELKTDTGRVKPEQRAWLDALTACGLVARIVRPRDWKEVTRLLQDG